MKYNVGRFAGKFGDIIDWMLADKYGEQIRGELRDFDANRTELSRNPDSVKALRLLTELIVTQAFYYRTRPEFKGEIDAFMAKYGANFRTPEAQADLVELVGKLARPRIVDQAKGNIKRLLIEYPTIREFTKQLYDRAQRGETGILGEKGRDNYLRDFGYWDRIPMDRHEMRFIIRTGIYHACSTKGQDPLDKASLHQALTEFCSRHFKGKLIEGIDLGVAPGIVDTFIWSYCGKGRYNVCGSTPKCINCDLKDVCLYRITRSR